MKSDEIVKKYLEFFRKKGHTIVPSSSLLPENDPSVLLTTAGMQQFKQCYTNPELANNNYGCCRTVSCQKSFRTTDIEEVGDESHLTFFEMLGNFSFGSYFKKEAIEWGYEFITKELGIDRKRITVSIFKGEEGLPEDNESEEIWKKLGFKKPIKAGRKDNFWGPTGEEGPCGPTTEIYADGIEIWNIVFNQYYKHKDGKLEPLKHKGIDTGMGLERLAAVMQGKRSVYETDLFQPLMKKIEELKNDKVKNVKAERVVADHTKGIVFLIADGVMPGKTEQGYVLRRLLRRTVRYARVLQLKENYLEELIKTAVAVYSSRHKELSRKEKEIITIAKEEKEKFEKTLQQGIKHFEKLTKGKKKLSGQEAFLLYQSFGFPLEIIKDLAKENKITVDEEEFEKEEEKHRTASKTEHFKSGLKEITEKTTRLHTATHLLQQALRDVLGKGIMQKGSNITPERLRFDFNHDKPLTQEQLRKVEETVNKKIKEGLQVKREEMTLEEAKKCAIAVFEERYSQKVFVYSIGNYSKEICLGPHVNNTKELGRFRITKEEGIAAGTRRIRAVVE